MPQASPTAKSKHRSALKSVTTEQPAPVVQLPVGQEQRPTTPIQQTRKRVARRPKYHETATFLERESFKGLSPTDGLPPPGPNTVWFPGTTLGEAYRVASTVFRAAQQASQETRPVSWGYGCTDGALGHNDTRRIVEIKRLAIFRRAIIRAVSAGNRLSLFLSDDNRIFQSGRLFLKQDGCAMWKPVEVPMQEVGLPASRANIVGIEAGHLAAYALDDHGRLYSWGTQIFGQLGHGEQEQEDSPSSERFDAGEDKTDTDIGDQEHDTNRAEEDGEGEGTEAPPEIVVVERTPRLVEGLAGHAIVKISAGNHFVVAVSTGGAVFSWGRGCFGQLGHDGVADASSPARIEALNDFVTIDIAAGTSHVLGVFVPREGPPPSNQHESLESPSAKQHEEGLATQRTVILVWGRGQHGCLGLGGENNECLPCENAFFRGLGASKVAAGADHSLVLCSVGAQTFLYAFGGNQLGQLGVASSADHVDMPSFLDEFVNVHVADIGAGSRYSAALTGDGEVFTWGDARYGQTCRSDGRTTFVPWRVDLPSNIPSASFITQLSIGHHHALAQLRIHGQVDRWRKFPLGRIVPALCHQEQSSKASFCTCKSSQSTTRSVLGIFVQCETCRLSPLCRGCCRRCHIGHILRPVAIGRQLHSVCMCSEGTTAIESSCVLSKRIPPAIPEEV
ncbi:hypothetical protein PRNP1_007791 [Phytophthora ramorum]